MTIHSLTPNLPVPDVSSAVAWYEETFDAEVVASLPPNASEDPWWAQIVFGDVSLMFQERSNLSEKLPALGDTSGAESAPLFMTVGDAQVLHDRLEQNGVEVTQPLHETEFGWFQFAIRDPNDYTLWFGEKITPDRMGPVVP